MPRRGAEVARCLRTRDPPTLSGEVAPAQRCLTSKQTALVRYHRASHHKAAGSVLRRVRFLSEFAMKCLLWPGRWAPISRCGPKLRQWDRCGERVRCTPEQTVSPQAWAQTRHSLLLGLEIPARRAPGRESQRVGFRYAHARYPPDLARAARWAAEASTPAPPLVMLPQGRLTTATLAVINTHHRSHSLIGSDRQARSADMPRVAQRYAARSAGTPARHTPRELTPHFHRQRRSHSGS
jgi:hypothetical protein